MNRRTFALNLSVGTVGALLPLDAQSRSVSFLGQKPVGLQQSNTSRAVPTDAASSRIVPPEQGPVWVMSPDRPMTFKLLTEQTNDSLGVFEELIPAGAGTPLHIHHTSDEVIHVLVGELVIKLGTQLSRAVAGTWVFIPRGTTHGWQNRSQAPARAAYVFTPGGGAKFFEELRVLGLPIPSIPPETLQTLSKRNGFEIVALDWE
jgi:quercetin dioxygenase-like cupin family protein